MTTGFLSLGSVAGTSIGDDRFSGFDYPNNAQVVALLGNGTSTYNAVLQQGALTARQGTLGCTLSTPDMLTIRGYYESRETVAFVDAGGASTDVVVLDFSRSQTHADEWSCTVTLLEAA